MTRRLLLVSDTLVGGHGAIVAGQAAWFAEHGWDVVVAAPGGDPTARAVADQRALPLPVSARNFGGMARAASTLHRLRTTLHPDVVHCHGARSFAATRLSGWAAPYLTLHAMTFMPDDPRGYGTVRRLGVRAIPRLAAGAFTVDHSAQGRWEFVVHASERLRTFETLPWPTGTRPTFLWVGRLEDPKQPEVFVRAMAEVARSRPDARGLVAGTGLDAAAVVDLVAATGAPVELLGHREDLPELLARAWAVTLFSRSEATPLSVMEAMWAGRSLVASRLAGIAHLVGPTCRLVDGVAGATEALLELCDEATARHAGAAAAARIRELVRPDDPWPALEARFLRTASIRQ